jgi:predicted lipoprotein with Yx(FWY)xxD motif
VRAGWRAGRHGVTLLTGAACAVAAVSCGTAAAGSSPPAYEVRASTVQGLGAILTDGSGRTLYLYVPDHQGPSVCFEVCAVLWPPLMLPASVHRPVAGRGIDAGLLGTVRRPGGALQVTYNRWPLYLYRDDVGPGQVSGQAEDMGTWYVVSVTGAIDRGVPAQGYG